jgi:hypothetical protein
VQELFESAVEVGGLLDVGIGSERAVGPTDQIHLPHVQSLDDRGQIPAVLRVGVPARDVRGAALAARIEGDDAEL